MASVFAAGEDITNIELQCLKKKSSKLSWFKRQSSDKSSRAGTDELEGEFRLIPFSERIFIAHALKSMKVSSHDDETVRVLQGWITDPNGVLPQSVTHAKTAELFPVAKDIVPVPNMWIKDVFYEMHPLKQVSDDEKHFLYSIRFYTNLKTILDMRTRDELQTQELTDSSETASTPVNHRFSRNLPDGQSSSNHKNRTINTATPAGFISVKMCSVNAPSRCSKSQCLASKIESGRSQSLVNLQAHFDFLIKNIFNGAVLAEPRIASSLNKESVVQMKTVQDNVGVRKKQHMMLSKSFELDGNSVESVTAMLGSMVRKSSVTKSVLEELDGLAGTAELVKTWTQNSRRERGFEGNDTLQLKTCTPSTNLTDLNALHCQLLSTPDAEHISTEHILAAKTNSSDIQTSKKPSVDQETDLGTPSPVTLPLSNFRSVSSTLSDDIKRFIIQSCQGRMTLDKTACQLTSDTGMALDSQKHVTTVGSITDQSQNDDGKNSIQPDQSQRHTQVSSADQSEDVLNQTSLQMTKIKQSNGLVTEKNYQPNLGNHNSGFGLNTPPPVVLSRKSICKEISSLSLHSSLSDNVNTSFHTESAKKKRAKMFSCCKR